jgi:hypothetical protein
MGLDWVNYDARSGVTQLADDGIIRPSCILSSGTGLGMADDNWYASGSLSQTGVFPINLLQLNFCTFQNEYFKRISTIRAFHIINLTSSGSIVIQNSGTSFVSGVQFLGGKSDIGPLGTLHWYSADGVVVTSGTRFIYLHNPNLFTVNYKVACVGLRGDSSFSTTCGFSNGFSPGFC